MCYDKGGPLLRLCSVAVAAAASAAAAAVAEAKAHAVRGRVGGGANRFLGAAATDGICAGFLALTEVYMTAVTANTSLPWQESAAALSARTTLVVCRNDIYGAIYSVIFQSCIATLKHIIARVSACKTLQIKLYSATVLHDSPR